MPYSQVGQDPSLDLTNTIIDAKMRKNLARQQLAEHVPHESLARHKVM